MMTIIIALILSSALPISYSFTSGMSCKDAIRTNNRRDELGVPLQLHKKYKKKQKETPPSTVYTKHATQRMNERGIKRYEANEIIKNGFHYASPQGDGSSIVFSKDKKKWAVIAPKSDRVITVVRDDNRGYNLHGVCVHHHYKKEKIK